MAPPATPSRTLPKSNFQQSLASAAAAAGTQLSASSIPPPDHAHGPTTAPHVDIRSNNSTQENTQPPFSHPDHVITPPNYSGIDSLIIVCCHAIFHPDASHPSFPLKSPHDERNWHLASFQQSSPKTGKLGEHETFLAHVDAGLEALVTGPLASQSLLVLSGGPTKSSLTPLSEARSYYNAALAQAAAQGQPGGGTAKVLYDGGRIVLEEHATDSFQNLLFSILLFRRTTGRYPKDICVITHAFKSKRFLELHAPAIRWPSSRVRVQGIDPVMSLEEYEDTVSGEERFGRAPWKEDPLGVGEFLTKKRISRGWKEDTTQELGDGLEDNVQQLLSGTLPSQLPWEGLANASASKVDSEVESTVQESGVV